MGLRDQTGRLLTALFIVVGGILPPAHAHFVLVSPDSWMSQSFLGDPQKVGPCGDEGGGTATGLVTAFRPGETIEITIDETIFHPGHYRVALAIDDRSELPPAPPVTTVENDPCGSTEIQDPPVFPILADNVLPHTTPFDGPQTFTVTLPADVTCTRCTLQILEYMSRHGRPCFYHHCADISIQGEVETPTSTPTPTATSAPAATSTATPPPPASCTGDCDEGGSVTIEELTMLVGIALKRLPIGACEAGNVDGDGQIAIHEVLAAVDSALGGCANPP